MEVAARFSLRSSRVSTQSSSEEESEPSLQCIDSADLAHKEAKKHHRWWFKVNHMVCQNRALPLLALMGILSTFAQPRFRQQSFHELASR